MWAMLSASFLTASAACFKALPTCSTSMRLISAIRSSPAACEQAVYRPKTGCAQVVIRSSVSAGGTGCAILKINAPRRAVQNFCGSRSLHMPRPRTLCRRAQREKASPRCLAEPHVAIKCARPDSRKGNHMCSTLRLLSIFYADARAFTCARYSPRPASVPMRPSDRLRAQPHGPAHAARAACRVGRLPVSGRPLPALAAPELRHEFPRGRLPPPPARLARRPPDQGTGRARALPRGPAAALAPGLRRTV